MTTQQETMRKLINLLEAVDTEQADGKFVPPTDPKEQEALRRFEKAAQSLEEGWKQVAAAGALSLATLFSGIAHAANPGGLIDTSSPAAAAQSCSMIMDVAISNNMIPNNLLDIAGHARDTYGKAVIDSGYDHPETRGAIQQARAYTKGKLQATDRATVLNAASTCVQAMR